MPPKSSSNKTSHQQHISSTTHLISNTSHQQHISSATHLISNSSHQQHISSTTHLISNTSNLINNTSHQQHISPTTHLINNTSHQQHISSTTHLINNTSHQQHLQPHQQHIAANIILQQHIINPTNTSIARWYGCLIVGTSLPAPLTNNPLSAGIPTDTFLLGPLCNTSDQQLLPRRISHCIDAFLWELLCQQTHTHKHTHTQAHTHTKHAHTIPFPQEFPLHWYHSAIERVEGFQVVASAGFANVYGQKWV